MDPLLKLSGLELARRIREGEISAAAAVERHIDQIQRVNPRLNAVVRDRFEQARLEAKRADERVGSEPASKLPPLLGVPCTIKESIALEGMPNSSGLVSRAGSVASEDATVVARLRSAGAIPLGVTNVPELTVWSATFNRVYGRTNNAYDPARVAGGSSGGEGAIIGAGGSPFGVGTDVGGSIRVPSFCNGVFGHKPSGGLVPGTGQIPEYQGPFLHYNTTGPLARRAEDLMPLLRILAGPDGRDPGCRPIELGDPERFDLARVRVFVIEGTGRLSPTEHELRQAQQRAAYALARRGASVEMLQLPELLRSLGIVAGMMLEAGGAPVEAALGRGEPLRLGRELARLLLRRSEHTYPPLLVALSQRLGALRPSWIRRNAERGRALRRQLETLMADDGVLLCPSARAAAPPHGPRAPLNFPYMPIFNVLELPVTQVPLGLGRWGLPLGVQVVGAHGGDALTIAAALELERSLGGWLPPA